MDALSEFQFSHRENVLSGHYNPFDHRERVLNFIYGIETKPEVGARPEVEAGPEVWTQPIGEVWPPGSYAVSVRGERPEVVRFRSRTSM